MKDTLSPELRTFPLPGTHVWVGYPWQNTGLRPECYLSRNKFECDFVSQPPPNRSCEFLSKRLSTSTPPCRCKPHIVEPHDTDLARMIFNASQACVIFHDTLSVEYPRFATPLPRALPITDSTLSTMRVPSTAIFRAIISDAPAAPHSRSWVGLVRLIP